MVDLRYIISVSDDVKYTLVNLIILISYPWLVATLKNMNICIRNWVFFF